jgi:ribosomal protein L40E
METITKSIDVNVPARTAYNQWTQFEEFPRFMEGVEEVKQIDDTRLHWVANIGGKRKEWYARITEQIPDKRIAWCDEGGAKNAGVVTFHRLDDNKTRVTVQIGYEPEGVTEKIGDMIGVVSQRIESDLERFKDFIEERGRETGAWRGTVDEKEPLTADRKETAADLTCPNCHSPVQTDWKFCDKCGTSLPIRPKHCTQCGAEISTGAKFCDQCGTKVG